MIVGCLGTIIFQASQSVIKTVRDVSYQGSSSIQTHKRHMATELPEFVGSNLETLTFNIRISKYLGVTNPNNDLSTIAFYVQNGIPVTLTLGEKTYGRYKWLVSKYKVTVENFDQSGNIVTADVNITLTEYPRR